MRESKRAVDRAQDLSRACVSSAHAGHDDCAFAARIHVDGQVGVTYRAGNRAADCSKKDFFCGHVEIALSPVKLRRQRARQWGRHLPQIVRARRSGGLVVN